jgi:hypothetical protein
MRDELRAARAAERRREVEAVLHRYPHLTGEEIADLVGWFKREATAMDVALLASTPAVHDNYRAFRDAHVDPLTTGEKLLVSAMGAAIVASTVAAMAS